MLATLHLHRAKIGAPLRGNASCQREGELLNTEPAPLPRKNLFGRLFDYISQGGKPAHSCVSGSGMVNKNTCAGGPCGLSRAEIRMLVSWTTRIIASGDAEDYAVPSALHRSLQ
jgi:hypothetical protein